MSGSKSPPGAGEVLEKLNLWKDEAQALIASVQVDVDLFPLEVEIFLAWLEAEARLELLVMKAGG